MTERTNDDSPRPSAPGRRGGFLQRAAERARQMGESLRDEYRRGTEGDTSPVQPIAPTAGDVLRRWSGDGESTTDDEPGEPDEAGEVADLLQRVDWSSVRRSVTDSDAVARMRDLAAQVDWRAARPVAASVASALIAAAASGQIGGSKVQIGRYLARTLANETGLAERVAQRIAGQPGESSTALVRYIDTTASEVPDAGFDAYLDDLGQIGGPDTAPGDEPIP